MKTKTLVLILLSFITLSACSKKKSAVIPADHNQEALEANDTFFDHPEEIILYNPNHPNAKNLKDCVFKTEEETSCAVKESPLLGMSESPINVNAIMDRTMASRASYLETFRSVLNLMPKETLSLFNSVNAIVISDRIIPSFYHYGSGAIYLSGGYFWKTQEEKEASSKKKDYRADFGIDLAHYSTSDVLKNGKSIYNSDQLKTRSDYQIAPLLIKLLFHELAHANDFFPKSYYSDKTIDIEKSYYSTSIGNWENKKLLSQNFKSELNSKLLEKIGQVQFQGEKADDEILNVSAVTVAREFNDDNATDTYAYSTPREDLATLVDDSLSLHFFDFEAFTIFVKLPHANFTITEDFEHPIGGGVKNKISAPQVKERAVDVLEKIFGQNLSQKISNSLELRRPVIIPEDAKWSGLSKI